MASPTELEGIAAIIGALAGLIAAVTAAILGLRPVRDRRTHGEDEERLDALVELLVHRLDAGDED